MNTKPDALKLASVAIFDRGIGWQADATATLKEQAAEIAALRADVARLDRFEDWLEDRAGPLLHIDDVREVLK